MDDAALSELVASIGDHGLLQPITVRRIPGGRFQIIAGHRRLAAFKQLLGDGGPNAREKFGAIPAHERLDVTDEDMALFALVENLQRDDLSTLDAAIGLRRFQEAQELSTGALAKRTGLELDRVKRLLRLSNAPKVVQDACHLGIMVEVPASGAAPSKRERVRLELMSALEFQKFHAHAARAAPKKADERTSKAINRALTERWSFRRVQAFCRDTTSGQESSAGSDEGLKLAAGKRPALFTDGSEVRIRRDLIPGAGPDERAALLAVPRALMGMLTA